MIESIRSSLVYKIFSLQDSNGCWNALSEGDKYYVYPELNYYMPKYKSTLWTLIFLADIGCTPNDKRVREPLEKIVDHFMKNKYLICSIGKSHFPIPCLNGNILYLLSYFGHIDSFAVPRIIEFFSEYQRFDDGDFKTSSAFPYFSNKSCYGKHTCYWGVVKLLKGLSFIPRQKRSMRAKKLLNKCISFILDHKVCFSSHANEHELSKGITQLSFPNMYGTDMLEILWLLKRERVVSESLQNAISLLKKKMSLLGSWKAERKQSDLIIPFGRYADTFITNRAKEVLNYYEKTIPAKFT